MSLAAVLAYHGGEDFDNGRKSADVTEGRDSRRNNRMGPTRWPTIKFGRFP